jgi:hypothetical protein
LLTRCPKPGATSHPGPGSPARPEINHLTPETLNPDPDSVHSPGPQPDEAPHAPKLAPHAPPGDAAGHAELLAGRRVVREREAAVAAAQLRVQLQAAVELLDLAGSLRRAFRRELCARWALPVVGVESVWEHCMFVPQVGVGRPPTLIAQSLPASHPPDTSPPRPRPARSPAPAPTPPQPTPSTPTFILCASHPTTRGGPPPGCTRAGLKGWPQPGGSSWVLA